MVPVIFVDGGDRSGIGEDLTVYGRPELLAAAIEKRPFDLVFKRNYCCKKYQVCCGFNPVCAW